MPGYRGVENSKYISAVVPIDTTGAGADGDWVSLKGYSHATIIIQQGAWAGGTPAVTVQQATTVAGGSAKALSFANYWAGTALTDDNYAKTTVSSDTYNLANAANGVNIIEIDSSALDVDGGFDCIRVRVASPGANADLISCLYHLHGTRYPDADPPSAIVD